MTTNGKPTEADAMPKTLTGAIQAFYDELRGLTASEPQIAPETPEIAPPAPIEDDIPGWRKANDAWFGGLDPATIERIKAIGDIDYRGDRTLIDDPHCEAPSAEDQASIDAVGEHLFGAGETRTSPIVHELRVNLEVAPKQLDVVIVNGDRFTPGDDAALIKAKRQARHDREHAGKLEARIRVLEGQLAAEHAEADRLQGLVGEALPAVRLVNDWAAMTDAMIAGMARAHPESLSLATAMRDHCRDRLGDDGFRVPPTYTEDQREAARLAVSLVRAPPREWQGALVDAVASALGMRKAGD